MEILVNDTLVSIFEGAKVKDVVGKYFAQKELYPDMEKIKVYDEQNHLLSLKGELTPGEKLKVLHS